MGFERFTLSIPQFAPIRAINLSLGRMRLVSSASSEWQTYRFGFEVGNCGITIQHGRSRTSLYWNKVR